ncbi:CHAT domain-containing protein [bacterium]|nr:CHAT domain-containing protein [bacterium]
MKTTRKTLLAIGAALLSTAASGRDPAPYLRLLTSDPSADYSPTVSQDGKHLVFVSERDGGQELYTTRLDAEFPDQPTAIAPSAASDSQPALSPNGKWLAWTSTREDAFGDVMVMAFPNGEPRALSERGIRDDSPQWVQRSGKLALRFRSTPLNGEPEWHEVAARRWDDVRPSEARMEMPDFPYGATMAAEPVDEEGPWLLFADDTNGDGVFGDGDRPSAWRFDARDGSWQQLTPPLEGLDAPRLSDGELVFGVNLRGNLDVALVTQPFAVAGISSARAGMEQATDAWGADPFDPYTPVALCRQGALHEAGSEVAGEAIAEALDVLREANRPEQGLAMLDWSSANGVVASPLDAELLFRRIVLTAAAQRRAGALRAETRAAQASASRELEELAKANASDAALHSHLLLEAARLALHAEDSARAIELALEAEQATDAPHRVRAEAALFRAKTYESLNLPDQVVAAYEMVLMEFSDVSDVVEKAALQLTDIAAKNPPEGASAYASVRRSADLVPDSPTLQAAAFYRSGLLLADAGNSGQAKDAWGEAIAMEEQAPRLAARSSFALAELLAREGKYIESIDTYESVEENTRAQFFPGAPAFYEQAREGLVREYLNKGNFELRVGDAALAANTFRELIDRRPELVEAWRGYLDARYRSGTLDKALLKEYKTAAKAEPRNALVQYRYGLALTYFLPIEKEAVRRLKAAIVLDGSVPYYHQTLGFVDEHYGRTRDDRGFTADALVEYQRALALVDPAARPTDYARLLMNVGNAAMGLDNYSRAAESYRRRIQTGEPFGDERTEFLMYRSYGMALFRTAKPREAAAAFQSAMDVIPAMVNYDMVTNERGYELETELLDRQALAFMEAGAHDRAAQQFARVADRHEANSLSRVRALRNRGFVLHRQALGALGFEREQLLREAEEAIRGSMALATSSKLVDDREPAGGGGLFSIEKTVAASEEGGARQGFAPDEEVRLLQSALAKILQDRGRTDEAIDALRAELNVQPKLDEGNTTYYLTIRLVTLDRLASELIRAGRPEEAAEALIEAIDVARFSVGDEVQTNGNGLSVVLARLTELALAGDDVPFSEGDLEGTWLLENKSGDGDVLAALDRALTVALELRTTDGAEHVLSPPLQRVRLLLARALVAERRAETADSNGLDLIRAATERMRLEGLARRVAEMPSQSAEGGEVKRLGIMARGLLIRSALQRGDNDEAQAELDDALEFATTSGFASWRWWLEAQVALIADDSDAAERALVEMEGLQPGTMIEPERIPWALLEHCEDLTIRPLAESGDWETAWEETARWRCVRLRLAFDRAVPQIRVESSDELAWLKETIRLRERLRAAIETLQSQPAGAETKAARAAMETAADELSLHIDAGRANGATGLGLIAPEPLPVADAAIFLEEGLPLPAPAALVLSTRFGTVAWTMDGMHAIASDSDREALARNAGVWFVMGDPIAFDGATVINMPTVESTYLAIENLWLDLDAEAIRFPKSDNASAEDLLQTMKNDLQFASSVMIAEPLHVEGPNPLGWQIGNTPMPLGRLLESLPPPSDIRADLDASGTIDAATRRAQEVALAAAFSFVGAGEAQIDGHRWVGANFSPNDLSDYAEAEIDSLFGLVAGRYRRGELARAVVPAQQLLQLLRVMNKPTGQVMQAGFMLAQIQGDLGRDVEAARTAEELVGIAREADNAEFLIETLKSFGNYANSARRFDDSHAAYAEAADLQGAAGNVAEQLKLVASSGVALENGGRYPEALEAFHRALELAESQNDAALQIAQWQRIGRIYLLRQNRYEEAGDAFAQALEIARESGDVESEIAATLDLARVDERLARYDSAVERAEAMEQRALELDLPLQETDAILLRAFVEWARASYLDAFRAERQGLELARQLNDRPFQIIAHNTAGLTHWSLNDTRQAITEFENALDLADQGLFRSEVASSHNNLGLVKRSMEQFDEALEDFRAALKIDREEGNRWGIAYAQKNIGITHIQSGQPDKAISPLGEAISLSEEIGDRTNNTKSLVAMGDAHRDLNENIKARVAYTTALDQARDIPLPEMEWRALYGLAVLDRRAGNLQSTRENLAAAISVVEGLRARIKVEEFQDGFLLDKQQLYDEMIALLLDQGEVREAFNYSERSRGRNFIDLLGNRRIDFASAEDRDAMQRDRRLRLQVESLQRRLSSAPEDQRDELRAELDEAKQEYSNFLVEIRASNPQLSTFVEVQPVDVAEIQSLLDPDTRLVVYHVLPEELVAWVIGPASFNVVRTPVSRDELAVRIEGLRDRLQEFAPVDGELATLSAWLMTPIAGLIEPAARVGIVPHRELHLLPFAAIRLDGTPLIEHVSLFHAPSASVLRYTFGRRGQIAGNLRVLAVGNPRFERAEMNLPFAEKEVERISWTFPDAEVVKGEEATESWVVDHIGDYGIIHLATHGQYDPKLPLLSGIQLATDQHTDGELTAREVFGLSLRADLVALSACQTGLGRISSGDEVVGLNRAFVYAGTRQILSSLWRVDDVSTAVMVKHFYRNVRTMNRAEALRNAQLEVRTRYPHPAHWSGLFLTGDWQ